MSSSADALPDVHPICDIFPPLREAELAALVADIGANGLLRPILLHPDGRLLDGRERLKACLAADVAPRYETWDGVGDLAAVIIGLNLHRRHLDESQRALVAAKLEGFSWGGARRFHPGHAAALQDAGLHLGIGQAAHLQLDQRGLTRAKAAALLNVSERSVASAAVVRDDAVAELRGAVECGAVSVAAAEAVARLPAENQAEIVARGRGEILQAAKIIRLEDQAGRKLKRDAREVALAGATARASARLGTRLYNVIYADPPWKHETWSELTGSSRAATNHYPVMELDAICAVPVPAAADAVLFLWRLPHMVQQAIRVVEAWGFDLVTEIVWEKDSLGLGYWMREKHETLMVCRRGTIPAPALGTQLASVQHAPRGSRHSAKPALFLEWIERSYPTVPKLEMFARVPRPGWDAFGNELTPIEDLAEAAHG